ncbi:hypothetical protein LTR22_004321 [Elasticomyces elasticus]|nr:hypothetical protein LTR22_004321 [Elasticomyces elasticus]KAK5765112.1 hypothetical protein LTS12_004623 [Elasticomyces elasticus]
MASLLLIVRPYVSTRLKIIRPYIYDRTNASPRQETRIDTRPAKSLPTGPEQLPIEVRLMIYNYIFEPAPAAVEFGETISPVPVIFQAVSFFRRSDLVAHFLQSATEFTIRIDSDLRSAELAAWVKSGICGRLQHMKVLRLQWVTGFETVPIVEAVVHFLTLLRPAKIEWPHPPPYDDYKSVFQNTVMEMERRTPNEKELAQLIKPFKFHWFYANCTESDDEGDDPMAEYGEMLGEDEFESDDDMISESDYSDVTLGASQTLLKETLGIQLLHEAEASHFLGRLGVPVRDRATIDFARACNSGRIWDLVGDRDESQG